MASPLRCCCNHDKDSSDLIALKISLLDDGQIGKSSFLTKYSGREKGLEEFGMTGAKQVDKTLCVEGAHISYSIWEVGDRQHYVTILQTAIPVIIGIKFDDFVQLPIDLQWTIASQARAYAKTMNATLFFSSAAYNINVNKIFKFITAKFFNLPWNKEHNLTVGDHY